MQIHQPQSQAILIKILALPKKFRKQLGFNVGDTAKAKIVGDKLIVDSADSKNTNKNLRVFTKEQIDEWVKEDQLPEPLASEVAKRWSDIP